MRLIIWFFILVCIALHVPQAHGESSTPADLIRIGVFSKTPKVARDELVKRFEALNSKKAAKVELGEKTAEGYYFHTYVPNSELSDLLKGIEGRVIVAAEIDPHYKQVPAGQSRVILTVVSELPLSQRDHVRMYQISSDAKQTVEKLISKLKSLGVEAPAAQPIRGPQDPGRELKFTVTQEQFTSVLDLAIAQGPVQMRFEYAPEPGQTNFKIRYLVDEQKGISSPSSEPDGQSWLHRATVSVAGSHPSAEEVRAFLQDQGARKAGEAELGSKVDGKPYFHFLIPQERLSEAMLFLAKYGTVAIDRRLRPRKIAQGQARMILDLFSLGMDVPVHVAQPQKKPRETIKAPTVGVLPTPAPAPVIPVPTPIPVAEATPAPTPIPTPEPPTRPSHVTRLLETDLKPEETPKDLQLYVEDTSPKQTYNRNLTLRGYVEQGTTLEGKEDPVAVDERGNFEWTLRGLEKREDNTRHLIAKSGGAQAEARYTVKRYPSFNINGGFGVLPETTTDENGIQQVKFVPLGGLTLKWWMDQLIGKRRHPLEFQRFGLSANFSGPLTGTTLPIALLEAYDLNYRFSSGIQEQDDTFLVSLALQRNHLPSGTTPVFLGVGAGLNAGFPRFVDMLFTWIPFLRFHKRIDIGVNVYPYIFGEGNSVDANVTFYAEPKMYFTPNFFIMGHAQGNSFSFTSGNEKFVVTSVTGYGGFGYLF